MVMIKKTYRNKEKWFGVWVGFEPTPTGLRRNIFLYLLHKYSASIHHVCDFCQF